MLAHVVRNRRPPPRRRCTRALPCLSCSIADQYMLGWRQSRRGLQKTLSARSSRSTRLRDLPGRRPAPARSTRPMALDYPPCPNQDTFTARRSPFLTRARPPLRYSACPRRNRPHIDDVDRAMQWGFAGTLSVQTGCDRHEQVLESCPISEPPRLADALGVRLPPTRLGIVV